MHELLNEEYWNVEFLGDDTDRVKGDLEALARDFHISEHELRNRFPYLYTRKDGKPLDADLVGCVWIKYTNKVATDAYEIEVFFEEHRHGSIVEVEVVIIDVQSNLVMELTKRKFDGLNCKADAAGYIEGRATELEALLKA